MAKKKIWNYGKKKGHFTEEEKKLSELLDDMDSEKITEISKFASDISMPLVNCEKLARTVIDQADLYDEEEREQRKQFDRALRRKRMLRSILGLGAIAVIIVILALCGVFDKDELKYYEASVLEAYAYSAGSPCLIAKPSVDKEYTAIIKNDPMDEDSLEIGGGKKKLTACTEKFPKVDEKRLENTIYQVVNAYCKKNDYAIDEYVISEKENYQDSEGNPYLVVWFYGTCLDYKKKDDGLTWGDLGCYTNSGATSGTPVPAEFSDLSTRMYLCTYTVAVKCE